MLELNKLTGQVDALGRTLAERQGQLAGRIRQARDLLAAAPEVSEVLRRKIEVARRLDEWRRGAIPLCQRLDERHRLEDVPRAHVLIAADGSQIFPDRHSFLAYYLLNIGTIVFRAGSGQAPTVNTVPEIFFEDVDLFDEEGQMRTADFIAVQRNRREMQALADLAEAERAALGGDRAVPIICLVDGPLLPWLRPDPQNMNALEQEIAFFAAQMDRLRRVGAIPVGYVDRPDSAYVLRVLELVELPIEGITREALRNGRFRQLTDRALFAELAPGERTGLFEPNSDANDRYQHQTRGHSSADGDRIAFAYLNVARPGQAAAAIARIEVPGWVASAADKLDAALAAIYANCEPVNYPYVLARAHELAVVGQAEKADLEQMLFQAMLRNGLMPEISFKASNKLLTAGARQTRF
ncbi:MAG: DNA double-strand break repair nuclease NurA [Anaerolineae bacterium]